MIVHYRRPSSPAETRNARNPCETVGWPNTAESAYTAYAYDTLKKYNHTVIFFFFY